MMAARDTARQLEKNAPGKLFLNFLQRRRAYATKQAP